MNKSKKVDSLNKATSIIALSIVLGTITYAWTGPTQSAPNGNVPAPINVGSILQEKLGGIRILGDSFIGTSSSPYSSFTIHGKAYSEQTTDGDGDATLVTKSYVDTRAGVYYSWGENNDWSQCSVSCGSGGTQTQTASCIKSDNTVVGDNFCTTKTKPVNSLIRSCNSVSCWCTNEGILSQLNGKNFSASHGMKHDASSDAVGTSNINCTGNGTDLVCTAGYTPSGWGTVSSVKNLNSITQSQCFSYASIPCVYINFTSGYVRFSHITAYDTYNEYWWFSDFKNGDYSTVRGSPPSSNFVCQ